MKPVSLVEIIGRMQSVMRCARLSGMEEGEFYLAVEAAVNDDLAKLPPDAYQRANPHAMTDWLARRSKDCAVDVAYDARFPPDLGARTTSQGPPVLKPLLREQSE